MIELRTSDEILTMSIEENPSQIPPPPQPSAVELIKENSQQLRGTLAEELAQDVDHFNDQNKQLLKFHGSYQQDNRDARKDRHRAGSGKSYMFMVRCKIPGGKVTPQQYLTIDRIAEQYANSTLRITSRQGFQLHGVLKSNLKQTIADINQSLLSTLGACGDVSRNVMAPAAPFATPVYQELQKQADYLAQLFAPRTRAYHEIWLNGESIPTGAPELPEDEPIYGKVYLPRKFKTVFALPGDNSTDIFAQDLGFLAHVEQDAIVGYNVYAGGGMGMTHGNEHTFPYLAKPICYVTTEQMSAVAEGVIKLFRDHGNRSDRKLARLKYVLNEWGLDKFREVLQTYVPFTLVLPKEIAVTGFPLHLGWHEQGDGKYFFGISVENGRIKDDSDYRMRTMLRKLIEKFQPSIRLTPMQDILLGDLPKSAKPLINRLLTVYGVAKPEKISLVQQHSMACPAVPTCGLALAEAERALPNIIDQIESELQRIGLDQEKISVRMTGCPNGCARPYQSDIGIVGRNLGKYTLFVGGNLVGSRLNFLFKDLVPLQDIVSTLLPLLEDYKKNRQEREGFGDYCQRLGQEKLCALGGG